MIIIRVFHGEALVRRDVVAEAIVSLVETQRLRCGHGSRRRRERDECEWEMSGLSICLCKLISRFDDF